MVDTSSGMQENRLQVKKLEFCGEARPTYFQRPTNGHSSPGIKCPESLCSRVTDLIDAGAPRYLMHEAKWSSIP
eukprot:2471447-Pyramimonas_sp.AAC.1